MMNQLPNHEELNLNDKIDIWLAKKVRWLIFPLITTGFFLGFAVKIPQIDELSKRVDKIENIENNRLNECGNLSGINKNIEALINLETDERQREVLKELLKELNMKR